MEATDELAAVYDSVKEPQLLGNYSWTNAPNTRNLGNCARHAINFVANCCCSAQLSSAAYYAFASVGTCSSADMEYRTITLITVSPMSTQYNSSKHWIVR
eukprot:1817-Heterococcus_DN1.PRE.1